jgi:glycosyltransferase involved in cell wall biosynthesis
MSVTVITATLPEREELLQRAVTSVRLQTLLPQAHLIGTDYHRRGGAAMKNDLAFAAQTKWIALLDDDDYLYPNHLSSLVEAAERDGSDIAYSYDDGARMYRVGFEPSALRSGSIVSHNAIVRTALFKELGGFDLIKGYDWHFWVKALDHGARFTLVQEATWFYDLSNEWKHESRS